MSNTPHENVTKKIDQIRANKSGRVRFCATCTYSLRRIFYQRKKNSDLQLLSSNSKLRCTYQKEYLAFLAYWSIMLCRWLPQWKTYIFFLLLLALRTFYIIVCDWRTRRQFAFWIGLDIEPSYYSKHHTHRKSQFFWVDKCDIMMIITAANAMYSFSCRRKIQAFE